MNRLKDMLKLHEGVKYKPYRCTKGYLTIGVGHNLDTNGIDDDIVDLLLDKDIKIAELELSKYSFYGGLSEARKDALIDFMFNVGSNIFSKFKRMIRYLEEGDFKQASIELLDSKYARQVGQRAITIANLINKGKY